MRSRLGSLLLLSLNSNFGISAAKYQYIKKRERLWEPILIAVSVLYGAGMLAAGVSWMTHTMVKTYEQALGQPQIALVTFILVAQFIALVFAIGFVVSAFYFARDLTILIPLPFRPLEVIFARFAVVYASELITSTAVLLPAFITYGITTHASLAYWLMVPVTLVLVPIIPLAIASVLVVILMRFVSFSSNKDLLTVIGSLLIIVASLAIQYFIQVNTSQFGSPDFMQRLLADVHGFVKLVGRAFPPSVWAALALSEAGTLLGFRYLVLSLLGSAALFAALLALGEKAFYRAVVAGMETGRRQARSGRVRPGVRDFAGTTPRGAVGAMERRIFLRTPAFMLNGLVGYAMLPVLMTFPVIASSKSDEFQKLLSAIRATPNAEAIGTLVVAAAVYMLSSMSAGPFSPFSREGKCLSIIKSLPLSGRDVFYGKLSMMLKIHFVCSLPTAAVLTYVLGLSLPQAAVGFAIGGIISAAHSMLGMMIDLKRPMLNWTDPQKAVKSNPNVLFSIIIAWPILVGLGFLVYYLLKSGMNGWLVVAIIGAISLILLALAALWVERSVEAEYRRLEV